MSEGYYDDSQPTADEIRSRKGESTKQVERKESLKALDISGSYLH